MTNIFGRKSFGAAALMTGWMIGWPFEAEHFVSNSAVAQAINIFGTRTFTTSAFTGGSEYSQCPKSLGSFTFVAKFQPSGATFTCGGIGSGLVYEGNDNCRNPESTVKDAPVIISIGQNAASMLYSVWYCTPIVETCGQLYCSYSAPATNTWVPDNGGGGSASGSGKTIGYPSSSSQPPCDSSPSNGASPVNPATSSPSDPTPNALCGNPINAATGNKIQAETDFVGGISTGLSLTRYYNSQATTTTPFGVQWRSTWHRSLAISGGTIIATRADGHQDTYTAPSLIQLGVAYQTDPDVQGVLTAVVTNNVITAYQLTTISDSVETYTTSGQLLTVASRAGLVTTLAYDANNNLTRVTGPFGHQLSFTYDGSGRIATMTAPDGGNYAYAYDGNNNLVSVTYPGGGKRQYVYEIPATPNALTGILDENGNRYATWSYDAQGRAVTSQHAGGAELTTISYGSNSATVTDARGDASTYSFTTQFNVIKPISESGVPAPSFGGNAFTYDANGFLASRTDYDGNITSYMHDARGNQTSRTEAAGTPLARTINTTWHPTFHLSTQITEPNRTKTFTYDAKGNLLTKTVTAGALTRSFSYTYNVSGQVLTVTDPRGNVTTYAYDAKGDLASVTNALGQVTSLPNYDADGRPLKIIDPNGVTTVLTYDPRGRILSRTVGTLTTSYAYDKAGNLIRVTLPDGSYLAYSYDAAHRLTGIADALGDSIAYTLDATSNITKSQVFDPSNNLSRTRSFAYDAVNRLSQIIGAQGQTTTLAYDPQSNLTSIADPLAHTTSYSYDALNRLAQAIDPNGGATGLGYDANDHLTGVTDPRGLNTAYAWDGLDDQTALSSPDSGVTARSFDAAGNVLTSTDARGATTTYSYDALNRRTSAKFADGTTTTWLYDQGAYAIGRLSQISDTTGSTSYRYDANGHVTGKQQVIGAATLTTLFAYDAGGRLASLTYPSGKQIAYTYDAAGHAIGLKSGNQNLVTGIGYEPFGAPSEWTAGNGAIISRGFDQDGRITSLALPDNDEIALAYDAASRITGMTETGLAAKSFEYDALDRLTTYAAGQTVQSYAYDADGNRVSETEKQGATTRAFAYSYPATSNRLAAITGARAETFTYDADGNTLTDRRAGGEHSFTYDARGRLSKATSGALAEDYGVNGLGQRVVKRHALARFNNGSEELFAYDTAGRLIGVYDVRGRAQQETIWLGDLPVAVTEPSGEFYVAPDQLGAPHQITNARGRAVWHWDHDPFGATQPTSAASFTYDLRFPGQLHDSETGLSYNYFRDYDPKTGRYIESDPIGLGGGINTYGYVGGNPVSIVDPNGRVWFLIILPATFAYFSLTQPANAPGPDDQTEPNHLFASSAGWLLGGGAGLFAKAYVGSLGASRSICYAADKVEDWAVSHDAELILGPGGSEQRFGRISVPVTLGPPDPFSPSDPNAPFGTANPGTPFGQNNPDSPYGPGKWLPPEKWSP